MYVWRKKNRRDRRNLLTSGVEYWGPPVGSKNTEARDEEIRLENEKKFVESLSLTLRKAIHKYLATRNGAMEINHVIHEIEILEAPAPDEGPAAISMPMSSKSDQRQRKNVREIFRKYDEDGSFSIDKNELKALLKDLCIPMSSDKEMDNLFKELDPDGEGFVTFDNFYGWFDREANNPKKKGFWHFMKRTGASVVTSTFKRMLLEIEARNAIIDKVVDDTKRHAYEEFRKAHPPRYPCTHPNCFECFPNASKLNRHLQDIKVHQKLDYEANETAHKFLAVDAAFKGNQGRRLHANRLLFSVDLADLKPRLHNLTEQPYRPHLSDVGSHREKQLRAGMLVLGADPKAGIRPVAMSRNLRRQHRANCTLPPVSTHITDIHQPLSDFSKPNLRSTLLELMQCRDQKIDTIVAEEVGGRIEITFEWKGYVHSDTEIIGEFNGWNREKMFPDGVSGRLLYKRSLCAGRYRYRYIVDGEETTDPFASQINDDGVVSNVILVANPPAGRPPPPMFGPDKRRDEDGNLLEEEPEITLPVPPIAGVNNDPIYAHRETIDLRNSRMCDDGAWALTVSVQVNSVILHLDLSYNEISDTGISAVAIAVERMRALRVLKLNGNGFSSDGVAQLVKVLKVSNTIERIEMCSNRIGDDGAEFIAESIIKFHTSLEELYLDSNLIGNDGAACIGEAMVRNRTLRVLSLGENRIFPFGADRLCVHLRRNGYLSSLRLHNNPLGPSGVKSVGDMLGFNDSIKHLDISGSNMLRNNDVQGYHAMTFALKRNRGLHHLVMRNSGLNSENIMELGYALSKNKGLKVLDMSDNYVPDKWYAPNTFIDTKLIMQMPSIRTSLDKNIATSEDPVLAQRYGVLPRQMEDGFTGIWTSRRVWTAKDREGEFQKAKKKKLLASEESARIEAEDIFVTDKSAKEIEKFKESLTTTSSGRKLVKYSAKVVDLYIRNLVKFAPTDCDSVNQQTESTRSVDGTVFTDVDNSSVVDNSIDWVTQAHKGILAAVFEVSGADEKHLYLPFSAISVVLESLCVPVSTELVCALEERAERRTKKKELKVAKKKQLVRSRSSRSFRSMPDAESLTSDDKMMNTSSSIGLSRQTSGLSSYTDNTGQDVTNSRPGTAETTATTTRQHDGTVDFHKFVRAFIEFAPSAIATHYYAHVKSVTLSMLKSKKREIAYNILLRAAQYSVVRNLKFIYRKEPDKAPKYLCEECNERFHSEGSLNKHKAKSRSQHYTYYRQLGLWRSREAVIREAKFYITGQRFPMYYCLRDALTLPRDFCPQVYDTHGAEARPIGVIEPEYLVRVNDTAGDWLKIYFDGGIGWMMLKAGSMTVMLPACADRPGFWDNLKPFHEPVFYHVCFELPDRVEIKVRYAPYKEAGVCGALRKGMVVSAGAVLDERWLEIRYNSVDSGWVLMESTAGIKLLKEVDESLQMSFSNILKVSPVTMTEEDLKPIEKPELDNEDALDDEVGTRPNTATTVASQSSLPYSDDASIG